MPANVIALTPPSLLIAASDARRFGTEVLVWLGVIVVVAFGAGILFFVLRRKLKQDAEVEAPKLGFTLADLREMHARGELTDEELQRAEARTLAESRALYLGGDEEEEAEEVVIGEDESEQPEEADNGGLGSPEGADARGADDAHGGADGGGPDGPSEGPESDEPENKV